MKKSIGAKTILFPTPVLMVGSYDKEGKPNIMNAAWGGICSSNPPAITVSIRKERHTYPAIMERKAFTVGVASASTVAEADYVGIVSGRNVDKFATSTLTAVKSDLVDAPYAAEFPVVLECRLLQTVEIGVHTQFIGEILDVKVNSDMLADDGLPDIMKIKPLIFDTSHIGYHTVTECIAKAFNVGKKKG